MKEKTFLATFTAIMLASLPAWACGLVCSADFGATVGEPSLVQLNTAFGSVFWIPASLMTFIALWVLRHNCRCKPALLAASTGIVPYSILSTLFLLDVIEPVLVDLFYGDVGTVFGAFAGLVMIAQGIYVAAAYLIAGGERRDNYEF